MKSNKQIIELWPSRQDLASDIDEKVETVRKWWQRDSIPAPSWDALIRAAKLRKYPVTAQDLVTINKKAA